MTLGGRVMEEIVFGDVSSGAQNDLERTTQIAYAIITLYGMNKKVGPFSFKDLQNEYSLRQPYSEETVNMIDVEARKFIEECYQRTYELLEKHREEIDSIAKSLMEKEVLYKEDFEEVLGKRNVDNMPS